VGVDSELVQEEATRVGQASRLGRPRAGERRGALLRAMIIPEKGGNTGWIDTIGVYKRLPVEVRTKLQGLRK